MCRCAGISTGSASARPEDLFFVTAPLGSAHGFPRSAHSEGLFVLDLRAQTDNDPRFTHEPRVLWTVQRITAPESDAVTLDGHVKVPKDHFRNIGRFPITLTHMLCCGVNYTFRRYSIEPPINNTQIDNCATAINRVQIQIAAPYSRYMVKRQFALMSLEALPTAEPSMIYNAFSPYASGPFGICRWNFEKWLRLPRKATIELNLSGYDVPLLNEEVPIGDVFSTVCFDEATTGLFSGDVRVRNRTQLFSLQSQSINGEFFPQVTDIFAPDAFGAFGGQSLITFNQSGQFRAKEFNRQETDRGQAMSHYTGFAIQIDQIDYDDSIQNSGVLFQNQFISPLSMRVGCRAKCTNGGTNMEWWRPGAPVALVCPTITPAQVFRFDKPIVLGPGEELEVEMQVPTGVQLTPGSPSTLVQPNYQIGLSMAGYATIE